MKKILMGLGIVLVLGVVGFGVGLLLGNIETKQPIVKVIEEPTEGISEGINLTERYNGDNEKKEQKDKEMKVDLTLEEIKEILTNFELPEEGQIVDETRYGELTIGTPNPEDLIVYENGFLINKKTKEVISITWIDGKLPKSHGTQALAHFKTLVKAELSEHFGITISSTDEGEKISGWEMVAHDIDANIGYIERLEEGLKDYPVIYNWVQEAKSHYLRAKELGIKNGNEAYDEYRAGGDMFDELKEVLE